jgi:hypothetical protein
MRGTHGSRRNLYIDIDGVLARSLLRRVTPLRGPNLPGLRSLPQTYFKTNAAIGFCASKCISLGCIEGPAVNGYRDPRIDGGRCRSGLVEPHGAILIGK